MSPPAPTFNLAYGTLVCWTAARVYLLVAAVLALVAIPAVATEARLAKPLVWIFNVWGTLDLGLVIALATAYDAGPFMGPAYWIPAFWVPALLVTHYITFVVLVKQWREGRG